MDRMNSFVHFQRILGEIIRANRKRIGMSQVSLAAKAGVSKRFLRDVEHGRCDIAVANLLRVSHELGLSMSELFRQVEDDATGKLNGRNSLNG